MLGVVLTVLLLVPGVALADEDGESGSAADLVQQAVALIANGAEAGRVSEKIGDALEAPDPAGVDLAKVEQAGSLVGDPTGPGELAQVRVLLVSALPEPAHPVAPMASGVATGTAQVLDEYRPARGISGGGDAVLLALAVASVGAGLYLARRWRPGQGFRELRRRSVAASSPRTGPETRAGRREGVR